MNYSILSEIYQKLESTTKKLEKADIIADFLKKTETEEIGIVIRLILGNVFTRWEQTETGIAEKLMIKAIAKSSGEDEKTVIKLFKEIGDLGLVTEKLSETKKQKSLMKKDLTVRKVFESIRSLAEHTGKNSQERKLSLVSELLISANSVEAKYITRTIMNDLRIGVAEGIVRDAIAKAFSVEPKLVENAWFLNPDYGEIAKIAKTKGASGLKNVKIEVGKPMVVLLAEKSPSLEKALETYENPALEIKYDGMRVIIQKKDSRIWIFTRRLEDVTNQFPDIINLCKKSISVDSYIIEGETLAMKDGKPLPFQKLSQRIQRKYNIEEMAKKVPVQVNLFDIVYLNGKMLIGKPLRKRRSILEGIVKPIEGKFQLSEQLITKDFKKAKLFYDKALRMGEEGLMVKNLDGVYQPGKRIGFWLKVKPTMENLDLVIIGAEYGSGKRVGWFGSFVLGCRVDDKFKECGMLGTGIKEKGESEITFRKLTDMLKPFVESEKGKSVKIKAKIVVEVAYEEIQKSPTYSSGWALRFPRFVRLRNDKRPEDVDDIERIKRLYEMQKGKIRK